MGQGSRDDPDAAEHKAEAEAVADAAASGSAELVVATAVSLRRYHADTLLVSISLIQEAYRTEIRVVWPTPARRSCMCSWRQMQACSATGSRLARTDLKLRGGASWLANGL